MALDSWLDIPADSRHPLTNLPYAATTLGVVTAVGDRLLPLAPAAAVMGAPYADVVAATSLDPLLAAGPTTWQRVRSDLQEWLTDRKAEPRIAPLLHDPQQVPLLLPFTVADYVDFYASRHHASNLGRLLRPGQPPLLPNWMHLPVGYHGRAGTVVVSGTDVRRPCGQLPAADGPRFGPSERLDIEAEIGFLVGVPSGLGTPVPVDEFADHVFGVALVNDWSARDIQSWEYQPLGPFLGKSFATSIGGWVTPLAALEAARVPVESSKTPLLPYLRESAPWGLDLTLEIAVNGEVLSRPTYRSMHWSPAQMLAHLTVNGATVRTGDLYASGTVSGETADTWGSLFELWQGERFLADGDEVVISATAPGADGTTIGLGDVRGRVLGPR